MTSRKVRPRLDHRPSDDRSALPEAEARVTWIRALRIAITYRDELREREPDEDPAETEWSWPTSSSRGVQSSDVSRETRSSRTAERRRTPEDRDAPMDMFLANVVVGVAILAFVVAATMQGARDWWSDLHVAGALLALGIALWGYTLKNEWQGTPLMRRRMRQSGTLLLAAALLAFAAPGGHASESHPRKPEPVVTSTPTPTPPGPSTDQPRFATLKVAGRRWHWNSKRLVRSGRHRRRARARLASHQRVADVASCGQRLLVVYRSGLVSTFSAHTGQRLAEAKVSDEPGRAACADGSVWITVPNGGGSVSGAYVYRGSPATLAPVAKIRVGGRVGDFARVSDQRLRIRRPSRGRAVSIDPETNTTIAAARAGDGSRGGPHGHGVS